MSLAISVTSPSPWRSPITLLALACVLASLLGASCRPSPPAADGGDGSSDARVDGPLCAADQDCDDGVFCNGRELCRPGQAGSNAMGCAPAPAAVCLSTQTCDEAARRCASNCALTSDADGDGHPSIDCPGGDDCDDSDRNRYPGNTEVCDSSHDEDCNPATVSRRDPATGRPLDGDSDGDGAISDTCCNAPTTGTPICGTDCDDHSTNTNPFSPEVCDRRDNNCNGMTDEGLAIERYFPDCDGDLYGDPSGTPISACAPPADAPVCTGPAPHATYSAVATDCDDHDSGRNPGGRDVCNGVDDNCDGIVDEDPTASDSCPVAADAARMSCWTGHCIVSSCRPPFDDCDGVGSNGCEVNTSSSTANCGGCGVVCPALNGSAGCIEGVCTLATCNRGFHACGDGCVPSDSVNSCGGLCSPCVPPANADSTCDGSQCGFRCHAGFHACGDQCLRDDSPDSCGSSCSPCAAPPANAAPTCSAGVCGFVCLQGYYLAAGQCLRGPRLIAPIATTTIATAHPLLRWELTSGADGARVEICRDRACTMITTTFDATGSSGSPSAALARGMYFWRARQRIAGAFGQPSTSTWEFRVGSTRGTVNGARQLFLDQNGDGYADLAITRPAPRGSPGRVYLYPGGPSGLATTPSATLAASSVANAGDVNGDGYGDLVTWWMNVPAPASGIASIYLGGPSGIADHAIAATAVSANLVVTPIGDVNGDGYSDVAFDGHVHYGSPSGIDPTRVDTTMLPAFSQPNDYITLIPLGDVNGDGYADVLLPWTDRLWLFLGRSAGPGPEPDGPVNWSGDLTVGDINGDGYSDVFETSSPVTTVAVHLGNPAGFAPTAPADMTLTLSETGLSGPVIGDADGDGFDDLVLQTAGATRALRVFPGGAAGFATAGRDTVDGTAIDSSFASAIVLAGDYDGNGFVDLAIGAPGARSSIGEVLVYAGRLGGFGTSPTPSMMISAPEIVGGFGSSLALLRLVRRAPRGFVPHRTYLSSHPPQPRA